MGLEDLTPELMEKAKACKSKEELAKLAEAMGVQLSDEELEAVAGGIFADVCPKDRTCIKQIIPCQSKCPLLFCAELFKCTELAPCPEVFTPIEIPDPTQQD